MHEKRPPGDQPAARRSRLASPATATALGVLVLVFLGLTVALNVLVHQATFLNIATGVPIPLVYAAVGVVVARNRPRNPVGWILILFVVLFLVPVDAGYYAVLRYRLGYHGLPFGPAAVVLVSLWLLAFMVFPLAILLFPDGRLISRWGWVLRGYAVAVAWVAIAGLTPALAAGISGNIQVNSSGDVTGTGHLAHVPGLRDRDRAAGRGVCRPGPAGHPGVPVPHPSSGSRLHAGRRGAVQSGAAASPACGGPALQPGPVRR